MLDGFRWSGRLRRALVLPLTMVLALVADGGPGGASSASAASLDVSVSSHYSTGKYGGSESIDIVYVPVALRYEIGLWSLRTVVPWIRVSGGTATVDTGEGPITTSGGTTDGFGDLLFEVQRALRPPTSLGPWAPWITPTLRVKAPTASEGKGLGTGRWDATGGFELAQRYGPWTPFVWIGFRVLGNSGQTAYHDGFVLGAGTLLRVMDRLEAGLFFDWRQASVDGADDAVELLPTLRFEPFQDWTIDAYATAGLTNSVPDVGTGLEIRYRFSGLPPGAGRE